MLGSLNLEIYLSHQIVSQIKKKISKLKQFSNNSHENSSMLGSLNLEIHLSHQNLSQIKKENLQNKAKLKSKKQQGYLHRIIQGI